MKAELGLRGRECGSQGRAPLNLSNAPPLRRRHSRSPRPGTQATPLRLGPQAGVGPRPEGLIAVGARDAGPEAQAADEAPQTEVQDAVRYERVRSSPTDRRPFRVSNLSTKSPSYVPALSSRANALTEKGCKGVEENHGPLTGEGPHAKSTTPSGKGRTRKNLGYSFLTP